MPAALVSAERSDEKWFGIAQQRVDGRGLLEAHRAPLPLSADRMGELNFLNQFGFLPGRQLWSSVAAFAPHASRLGAGLLWAWAGAIALSTLLTHQHHLVDVATGWALGVLAYRVAISRATLSPSCYSARSRSPS